MTNAVELTNSELLGKFYAEALTLGVAIGRNESFTEKFDHVQELWDELAKRFIKPQEAAH